MGKDQQLSTRYLPAESFLLCLQTKHQKEVLQQFGANVLCMDPTHGTNHYDFKLITVMVADQLGQGLLYYPVLAFKDSILVLDHVTFRKNSWLVQEKQHVQYFLQVLKDAAPSLTIMTDDGEKGIP